VAREEALKTNLKSKKTDEQAREKAQKAQQDEAERVQQQAANKACLLCAVYMAIAGFKRKPGDTCTLTMTPSSTFNATTI
jgi:hypothetical protein